MNRDHTHAQQYPHQAALAPAYENIPHPHPHRKIRTCILISSVGCKLTFAGFYTLVGFFAFDIATVTVPRSSGCATTETACCTDGALGA